MRSYAIGRVYKIVNSVDELKYIGSTGATLSRRMVGHRCNAKKGKTFTIYTHMREIGIDKFSIILIEQLNNVTKEQLRAREDYWIKELDTVNNGLNGRYEMSPICPHNKQHAQCKECGGCNICIHNKYWFQCKECEGSSICIHNKRRNSCKECNGDKYKCELCNKVYCSNNSLKYHNLKHHPIIIVEPIPDISN